MIKNFRDRETEKLFFREGSRKFPPSVVRVAMRKLWMLDAATALSDLKVPPGNRLESLVGSRKGQYSIRINKQWRVCFVWEGRDAHQVEIVDYH